MAYERSESVAHLGGPISERGRVLPLRSSMLLSVFAAAVPANVLDQIHVRIEGCCSIEAALATGA
jgi:hypothetical protein